MTTPTWPFSLAKPGGYIDDDVPTPTELNLMMSQIAAAASGAMYTEAAIAKEWTASDTVPTFTNIGLVDTAFAYDFKHDQLTFVYADTSGGSNPVRAFQSTSNGRNWADTGFTGGGISTARPTAAASDGNGTVAFAFQAFNSLTPSVCWTSDAWATRNLLTPGVYPVALHYSQALALWVIMTFDGHIYSAVTINGTWTLRATMGIQANQATVAEGNGLILISFWDATHSSAAVWGSSDGLAWSAKSVPFSAHTGDVARIAYSSAGFFVAVHSGGISGGGVHESSYTADGVTWIQTAGATTIPRNFHNLRCFNRMLVGGARDPVTDTIPDIYRSFDLGITWRRSGVFNQQGLIPTLDFTDVRVVDGGLIAVYTDMVHNTCTIYRSPRILGY
jgi:hypothetical protein